MPLEKINTIVEGCMPDTPGRLMYEGLELEIPKNANCLFCEDKYHPIRHLLYARSEDFSDIKVINNPFFKRTQKSDFDSNNFISGGWPIKDFEKNFRWVFDAQRSLTTRDGRIYISIGYFEELRRWYLDAAPTILKECGEIFLGKKDREYFYDHPSRAF